MSRLPDLSLVSPGTEHPAYAEAAAATRKVLQETSPQTFHIMIGRPAFMLNDELYPTKPVPYHTLIRHHVWALAPYVGEPFVYWWVVYVDELGRHVSLDSEIVYPPYMSAQPAAR